MAADPTPLPIPDDPDSTPVPALPGGGGGGGGSYSPPVFKPYSEQLKSSDGTVIGSIDVKDYSKVIITASNNTTIGNGTYLLTVNSELDSKPEKAVMDVSIGYNETNRLPVGMNDAIVLFSANVSRSGKYGWALKPGTVTMNFTMPASALGNVSENATYYLVRYDGTAYQVMPASVTAGNDTVTATAAPSTEEGIFTIVLASPPKPDPTPTPTPTPTATPAPTPTPTPVPAEEPFLGKAGGFTGMLIAFIGGAMIGAMAIFILGKFARY